MLPPGASVFHKHMSNYAHNAMKDGVFGFVFCSVTSHSVIFQLYIDGMEQLSMQFPTLDLLPGTNVMGS